MKNSIIYIALPFLFTTYTPNDTYAATDEETQTALINIERAIAIIDATWEKTMYGTTSNLYMADLYDTETGTASGTSDVWPFTAAIEAHCSLLEALNEIKDIDAELYEENFDYYKQCLDVLIDNLEYYRGTYRLSSYATSNRQWSPYAVPRASSRGGADVSGILNVYDDQMWLSRELIRAYRVTGTEEYLELATYLADYVLDGWDCWRDDNGNEYGGITWGPGYNSKHSCSNAPVIQPLVWLYDIYKDSEEQCEYYYRDEDNNVTSETRYRSDHYLEFARKVYDWQKEKLMHSSGVYWDMLGADNTISVKRGYRQHVDCGDPSGNFYSYNTGTMISGGAELYRVTGDETLLTDLTIAVKASFSEFATYYRKYTTYEFNTDDTAESGFNTWFNDVLMRSYIDALFYSDNDIIGTALDAFQTCLDYGFENNNRDNMLPIHLLEGWGSETKTKGFHQFAFASEYAMLAVYLLTKDKITESVSMTPSAVSSAHVGGIYSLSGMKEGIVSNMPVNLPNGIYIVGERKFVVEN